MYSPHTDADRRAMLETIRVDDIEKLFHALPAEHLFPELDLPPG